MFREKIKIIQKIMNNKLSEIRTSFRNSTDKGENAEEILSTEQDNYYQAKWTADELVKIVENGSFSDTILNLDINKKNPLKKN